jgi:hypothetical protein
MWLVDHGRCWTADRLVKKGMPHPQNCLLCDREEETLNHLLVSCVFSWKVWFNILRCVGLQHLVPSHENSSFENWWERVNTVPIGSEYKGPNKGLNSLIILGAWAIWNHRNRFVFNGIHPSTRWSSIGKEESHLWCRAKAHGLSNILML